MSPSPTTARAHRCPQTPGEQGFAMIIAITVLFIALLLTGAAVMIATQTNSSSSADYNRKNALEAAEAGLVVATYRLNMLQPASGCQTDSSTATAGPDANNITWCQSNSYTLGNGSSYQYYVSPTLSSGTCAGVNLANSSNNVIQRCITSVGTSNAISERSQIRVAAFQATPQQGNYAVLGYNGIQLSGGAKITGLGETNKVLQASGGSTVSQCVVGQGGSYNPDTSFCTTSNSKLTSTFTPGTVSAGTSSNMAQNACPSRVSLTNNPLGYCNDDFRITNLVNSSGSPQDVLSGGSIQWNATTRVLTVNGGGTLKLGGTLYNFCAITLTGGSILSTAGQNVQIIVDNGTADGCAGTGGNQGGYVNFSGGSITNLTLDPSAFQVDVVGAGNVTLSGGSSTYGQVFAPQSSLTFSGGSTWNGTVTADTVNMSGGSFSYVAGSQSVSGGSNGTYFRTAWVQCTSAFLATSPGANCG